MMRKINKQELAECEARLRAMGNDELLDETLLMAHGDDWDGGFTAQGREEYAIAQTLLRDRLKDWLTSPAPPENT